MKHSLDGISSALIYYLNALGVQQLALHCKANIQRKLYSESKRPPMKPGIGEGGHHKVVDCETRPRYCRRNESKQANAAITPHQVGS